VARPRTKMVIGCVAALPPWPATLLGRAANQAS